MLPLRRSAGRDPDTQEEDTKGKINQPLHSLQVESKKDNVEEEKEEEERYEGCCAGLTCGDCLKAVGRSDTDAQAKPDHVTLKHKESKCGDLRHGVPLHKS